MKEKNVNEGEKRTEGRIRKEKGGRDVRNAEHKK
jgi:hypothetical protein